MLIVYVSFDMIVDLEVHVEIVHHKCRQGSNLRPREVCLFLSSPKYFFLVAKDLATYFNMRLPRKIKVGFAKDSGQYFFYSRRMAVCRGNLFHRVNMWGLGQ